MYVGIEQTRVGQITPRREICPEVDVGVRGWFALGSEVLSVV